MGRLLDQFDMIRVINLPSRPDRRREMEAEFRRIGLLGDPRIRFFDAVRPDDQALFYSRGAHGCYLSHLAILSEAAAANASVLIFEDDVDFSPSAAVYGITDDWDVFYGGYDAANPDDLQNSDIIGSHFMGFNKRIVGDLLAFLSTIPEAYPHIVDGPGKHPPIDGAYVWYRRSRKGLRTVFAEPQLGWQRPSPTDIGERHRLGESGAARIPLLIARGLKRRLLRLRMG